MRKIAVIKGTKPLKNSLRGFSLPLIFERNTAREKTNTRVLKRNEKVFPFLKESNSGRYFDRKSIRNRILNVDSSSALASVELLNPI